MRLSSLPTLLSGLLSCLLPLQGTTAHPSSLNERHHVKRAFTSVDDFKTAEYPIALSGLFANIGPSGSKAGGSAAGVVLASPSKCEYCLQFVGGALIIPQRTPTIGILGFVMLPWSTSILSIATFLVAIPLF